MLPRGRRSRSRSCPASPPASPRRPTRASRSPIATLASGVAFVTGHEDPAKPETALDWPALAALPRARSSSTWACARCRGSPSSSSPAAARRTSRSRSSSAGTLPGQRTLLATLADVAERAAAEGIRAPAITLVGPVARAAASSSRWLERRPLHGRTVAVTRARPQASALAARLRELGADGRRGAGDPHRAARRRAAGPRGATTWSASRRPTARTRCSSGSTRPGCDARALAGRRVAAIGPGTARALGEHGIRADVVPERAVAEGLVEALAGRRRRGAR